MIIKFYCGLFYIALVCTHHINAGEAMYKINLQNETYKLEFPEEFKNESVKKFIEEDLNRVFRFVKEINFEEVKADNETAKVQGETFMFKLSGLDRLGGFKFIPEEIRRGFNQSFEDKNGEMVLVVGNKLAHLYKAKYEELVKNTDLLKELNEFAAKLSQPEYFDEITKNKNIFFENVYKDKNVSLENASSFVRDSGNENIVFSIVSVFHIIKINNDKEYKYEAYLSISSNTENKKYGLYPCVYIDEKWKFFVFQMP
jgi:hypothetical protein